MPEKPVPAQSTRLVITAGVHHRDPRPLMTASLFFLVMSLVWLVMALFPNAFSPHYAEGATAGVGFLFGWFVLLFSIASWRYVTVLDKAQGKVICWSGFIFGRRKVEEFDLNQFTSVSAGEMWLTSHTPQGEIVPEFVSIGSARMVRNIGQFVYHRVFLSGPDLSLDLQEFRFYPGAHRLVARVAAFLGLPGPPEPKRRSGALSVGVHILLHQAAWWLAGFSALTGGFIFLLASKHLRAFAGQELGGPISAIGLFILMAVGFFGASYLVGLLPASCLRCGGFTRRRYEFSRRLILVPHYRCRECGFSHRP